MDKIIVILGPTAVGKTDLSIYLAKKFNGEIVSADSRQVYKGMNIGTGKVTKGEMKGIPHHLLDIISPKKQLTVADYKKKAQKAISEILKTKKLPILIGGTGFYIQAVIDNIVLPNVPPDTSLRKKLETKDTEVLLSILKKLDKRRYEEMGQRNRVRIIRAIEIATHLGKVPKQKKGKPLYNPMIIGLDIPKEKLEENIKKRLLKRLKVGMLAEIRKLHKQGISWKRMEELGLEYRYGSRYVRSLISKEEFIETLSTKIRQYAKRQKTWFKRDKRTKWFEPTEIRKIEKEVKSFLG